MIAYLIGVLTLVWMPSTALAAGCLLFAVLALVGLACIGIRRPLVNLAWFIFGFASALTSVSWDLHERLPEREDRLELLVSGYVSSLNVSEGKAYQSITLELDTPLALYPQMDRLRLGYYNAEPKLGAGDQISALARITPPIGYSNDSGSDAVLRDLRAGVDGRGYIKSLRQHNSQPNQRQLLADYLSARFNTDTAALLLALTLGETQGLTTGQWDSLKDTGTIHLAIVSGIHLGVVTLTGLGLGIGLLALAVRLVPFSVSPWMIKAPYVLAMIFATLYLWIGGFGLPLQRSWIMAMALLVGRLSERLPVVWWRLRLALILVTLIAPLSVLQMGFWLSFGLVGLLILIAQSRKKWGWAKAAVLTQLVLSLACMPILLAGSGQLNINALFSNIWAIPWISLGVIALPLLIPVSVVSPWAVASLELWSGLFWQLLDFQQQVGLSISWPSPPLWLVPVGLLGVILLLAPLRLRVVGVVLLISMLFPAAERLEFGDYRVDVLDVGQGQSAVIKTRNQTIVYDTGPAYASGFSVASLTLLPMLRDRQVTNIDLLVLSHSDNDHAGGSKSLMQSFEVKRLVSGQPDRTLGESCEGQLLLEYSGVSFQLIKVQTDSMLVDNDQSCSLLIDNGICRFLIMGDLSANRELSLLETFDLEPVTWLQLSHHGSNSSTPVELIRILEPKEAIVSRGRYNRFGHPSARITALLNAESVRLWDTALDGQITLLAVEDDCSSMARRKGVKRLWR